jgi:hypothetical protein
VAAVSGDRGGEVAVGEGAVFNEVIEVLVACNEAAEVG